MNQEDRKLWMKDIQTKCRVNSPNSFELKNHQTDWTGSGEMQDLGEQKLKKKAKKLHKQNLEELS